MQSFTNLLLLAGAATPVLSAAVAHPNFEKRNVLHIAADVEAPILFAPKVFDSEAYKPFISTEVVLLQDKNEKREDADPNRPAVIPDAIYTLQCTGEGFQGDCLVFGAKPGACLSYFDFQDNNSTEIIDRFNNKLSSFSSNTGGRCQWYFNQGCNNKGDDRGYTSAYNYNLGLPDNGDAGTIQYQNNITSWRC
ncbi:hypothetical protein DHEL01_v207675 [Diaporthe helianthi]|uniref:Uncharacterized protein n=1 Tax=Diaporthe helianthi TaxID=158607 RepID=A0A2P5HUJ3_DIAHE|nr:hypothetical protein DHEL01_v207675 [Diaporthe helianthi]